MRAPFGGCERLAIALPEAAAVGEEEEEGTFVGLWSFSLIFPMDYSTTLALHLAGLCGGREPFEVMAMARAESAFFFSD